MNNRQLIEILRQDFGVSFKRIAEFLGEEEVAIKDIHNGVCSSVEDYEAELLLLLEQELDKRLVGCANEAEWLTWKKLQLIARLAREIKDERFEPSSGALRLVRKEYEFLKGVKA